LALTAMLNNAKHAQTPYTLRFYNSEIKFYPHSAIYTSTTIRDSSSVIRAAWHIRTYSISISFI